MLVFPAVSFPHKFENVGEEDGMKLDARIHIHTHTHKSSFDDS